MAADDVNFFFMMREQIKLYHWQTKSYSRHKATDGLISSLDESIDKYVEVYMGKYGRPHMSSRNNVVKVMNLSEKSIVRFIQSCIGYINGTLSKRIKATDTDLASIRDDMLAELNQILYLFTLQ